MKKRCSFWVSVLFAGIFAACSAAEKNPAPSLPQTMQEPSGLMEESSGAQDTSDSDGELNGTEDPSGIFNDTTGNTGSSSSFQRTPDVPKESSAQSSGCPSDEDGKHPIFPAEYQKLLGKGMDVDWSKTNQGRKYYNAQAVTDFSEAGISHVRIRIADNATDDLLKGLDQQIKDCLNHGIIPIIAYQADEFKNAPTQENIKKVVDWWATVAQRYQNTSYLLSFDLLIESTDALNKQPEKLNEIYEQLVTEIRKTNPDRIIMISPRFRSDPAYLHELEIPTQHNGYLMAEWHFYAAGPSKTNDRKLWTTGTPQERALIDEKIQLALEWQKNTGIPTWVGAWMPGNYNDGNDYTIEEQISFASYITQQLTNAGIPFAVNSDTKFYDRQSNEWISEMMPVFNCIYN